MKKQYYCTTTTKLVVDGGRQEKELVAFYKDIQNDLLLPDTTTDLSQDRNNNGLTTPETQTPKMGLMVNV